MQQTITLANVDPHSCCYVVSLVLNEVRAVTIHILKYCGPNSELWNVPADGLALLMTDIRIVAT